MKTDLINGMLGLMLVTTSFQQPVPSCQDVHTESCIHFHDSRPDLCSDPTFADNMCKRFCGNCHVSASPYMHGKTKIVSVSSLECYSCTDAVKHPQDCNTTTTCGKNMQCVKRQLRAKDGHQEYVMSCESAELCQLLAGTLGKRHTSAIRELDDETGARIEREVVMSCCDTDLCNVQVATTTSAAPTTTPPAITTAATDCNKDVVFVMENFVRLTSHETYGSVSDWIPHVQQIASHLNVSPGKTHVAALTFDRYTQVGWYLNKYTTSHQIQSALGQLTAQKVPSSTDIGDNPAAVFNQVSDHVFTPENGDRRDRKNVVVVFEHGAFNGMMVPGEVVPTEVAELHNVSDNVILVSVAADPDAHHYGIATDHSHEIRVDFYSSLRNLIPQIVQLICA